MFKNNENKNSEIKIIKISSKLFERNPSIESLFSKPRRLNLEERTNFLAASTSPKTFNRYERRQELNQIIKLHHQANVKMFKIILGKSEKSTRIHTQISFYS